VVKRSSSRSEGRSGSPGAPAEGLHKNPWVAILLICVFVSTAESPFFIVMLQSIGHPTLTPRRLGNTWLSEVWHSLGVGLVAFWLLLLVLFVTALANRYMTPSPVTAVTSAYGW
jgi:hypothetical protein